MFIHRYWAGGATTGALLGAVLPARITGLDFAVTALFTVLTIDASGPTATSPPPCWPPVAH